MGIRSIPSRETLLQDRPPATGLPGSGLLPPVIESRRGRRKQHPRQMGIAGIRSAKKSLVVQDTSMPVETPCKQITGLTALHVKEAAHA